MKSQNLEFLRPKHVVLAALAGLAENYAFSDPASSLIKQRSFYDLSINRHKEAKHIEVEHAPPKHMIAELRKLEAESAHNLEELEAML